MNQTPKPRRRYDEVFKREAVNHWLASGLSAETIAQELGLKAKQIYAWRKRFAPSATAVPPRVNLKNKKIAAVNLTSTPAFGKITGYNRLLPDIRGGVPPPAISLRSQPSPSHPFPGFPTYSRL
ncbi:MAG: transposase, partial [Verrucomicrobiota bacterium]